MSTPLTPSAILNEKVRKRININFPSHDRKLISNALSLVRLITEQKIELCLFEKNAFKITYKQNGGREYFDLCDDQELLTDFMVIFFQVEFSEFSL